MSKAAGNDNEATGTANKVLNGEANRKGRLRNLVLLIFHYMSTRYGRSWSSRARFERWQQRRVLRHLAYVRAQSSFYRELWGSKPLTQWKQFPLIDKTMMMKHFNALNTAGIDKDAAMNLALEAEKTRNFAPQLNGVTVGLSSGTSGNRGLFLVSEREQAAWAGTMLAKVLPGPLWKGERIAFFLRANSNLYESVRGAKLQFQYFDLLEPVEEHVKLLNKYQPGILVAAPSMLRLLAAEQRSGRLIIAPHRMISVAEVLDPLDAARIEEAFSVPIHQVYQCTEGFLASSCRYGTLHLNEDIVHIEKQYMAEDFSKRKFVPIVTDFSRTTQPIIRYRLNDVLTECAEACPCGSVFTAIERIEGRCDDIFYTESITGDKQIAIFPDYITRAIITSAPMVEEYRVIQHESGEWEIQLLLAEKEKDDDAIAIGAAGSEIEAKSKFNIEAEAETDAQRTVEAQVTAAIQQLMNKLSGHMPNLRFTDYTFESGASKLRRVERR